MSAFWGKRTCRFALHMSAFDPKRTFEAPCARQLVAFFRLTTVCAVRLDLGSGDLGGDRERP
jgi:hypothetical protein